jgi:DNA-binding transcriptional MerR regulator/methylmalonyl-CoA mutase cobalamin-binding subunit
MSDAHHPIQLAARLTGLSTYVIRIWEQRYRAVEPSRTPSQRRLYSQSDIERLSLLRQLTQAGHSIGQIARLPIHKLRALAAAISGVNGHAARDFARTPTADGLREECWAAIRSLNAQAFEDTLKRAATSLGTQGVLRRLIAPLAQTLGDAWREGQITAAHEHFATGVLRAFLSHLARPFGGSSDAPVLVVATPSGQLHELGAMLAGAVAANLGWRVTHLGASLPAVEIAGAARQQPARAVALSLVYPEDDARLPGELTALRASLPEETALLVGGRAASAYRPVLQRLGAVLVEDLDELGLALDRLRRPARKATR